MPLPDRLPEFARLVALAGNFSVADPHARTILLAGLGTLADGLRADLAAELDSGTGELAEPIESALARLEALAAPLDRRSGPLWEKSDRWARIECGKALAALMDSMEWGVGSGEIRGDRPVSAPSSLSTLHSPLPTTSHSLLPATP